MQPLVWTVYIMWEYRIRNRPCMRDINTNLLNRPVNNWVEWSWCLGSSTVSEPSNFVLKMHQCAQSIRLQSGVNKKFTSRQVLNSAVVQAELRLLCWTMSVCITNVIPMKNANQIRTHFHLLPVKTLCFCRQYWSMVSEWFDVRLILPCKTPSPSA